MAFARFNPCDSCCNCKFTVSYAVGSSTVEGVLIEVRDIRGSGVGSCITTSSGCNIQIKRPGFYYVYNDFCGTSQLVSVAKCGNDISISIGNGFSAPLSATECFFDVPLTQFELEGPGFQQITYGSGNALVGSLQFPQLAARGFFTGPMASGHWFLTVSDMEDNYYSETLDSGFPCNQVNFNPPGTPTHPAIAPITLSKKWGYRCSPSASINGCRVAGVTISDTDGHSATTDDNGRTHEKWKYFFPKDRSGVDPYTYITASKGAYIPDADNPVPKPYCGIEPAECGPDTPFVPEYTLRIPTGYWAAPKDDCLEPIPGESLVVSYTDWPAPGGLGNREIPLTTGIMTIIIDIVGTPTPFTVGPPTSPFNFIGVVNVNNGPSALTNVLIAEVGVYPRCTKEIVEGILGGLIRVYQPGYPTQFPNYGFGASASKVGTAACPTMFTVTELYRPNGIDWVPTGRSATVH